MVNFCLQFSVSANSTHFWVSIQTPLPPGSLHDHNPQTSLIPLIWPLSLIVPHVVEYHPGQVNPGKSMPGCFLHKRIFCQTLHPWCGSCPQWASFSHHHRSDFVRKKLKNNFKQDDISQEGRDDVYFSLRPPMLPLPLTLGDQVKS